MTVNKVILIGNLGQDPELRSTQSGAQVCSLRIATSERRRDREGNWSDHTEWHSVVTFGRTAENVARYMKKGRQIYIEGRLQTRRWQDRNGQDRWTTEIVADNVRFLSSGGRGGNSGGGSGGGYSRSGEPAQQGAGGGAGAAAAPAPADTNNEQPPFDDDVPF